MKSKIEKYKNNQKLDLEKVIDEYSGYVYSIIRNMASEYLSEEDIEEIVSDTFFILWKNTDKLDDERVLSSYIAGITKNLVKEKRRVIKINFDISEYENIMQDNVKVDMICEQREKVNVLEKTVKQLKEDDILIFNLYYYSSMKISEISNVLNISDFNVKMRLHRIRKKIKKEFSKGGYSDDK
ncbi:MAG: sigma-70 family RNA polymerase sigma factor [Clostridia bacterium]|nr:sigma-70 family RNA polymerase sigma factor [Clostridia bacterium]